MTLPRLPKEPRVKPISLRLSELVAKQLKTLADEHGLSQADVVTYLITEYWKTFQKEKKGRGGDG